jgi:hypothetical protein
MTSRQIGSRIYNVSTPRRFDVSTDVEEERSDFERKEDETGEKNVNSPCVGH